MFCNLPSLCPQQFICTSPVEFIIYYFYYHYMCMSYLFYKNVDSLRGGTLFILYLRHDTTAQLVDMSLLQILEKQKNVSMCFVKARKPEWKQKAFFLIKGVWVRRKLQKLIKSCSSNFGEETGSPQKLNHSVTHINSFIN